jgi:hypothetical protein
VVTLTLEEFTYAFVNTFGEEDAAAAFGRYAVPETGQIFYQAGFANFHLHPPTKVHFKQEDRVGDESNRSSRSHPDGLARGCDLIAERLQRFGVDA